MKKGIIFDVDGTLWDSATQVAQSWQVAAEKLLNRPRPITPDMISRNMGKNMKDFGDALFPDLPVEKRMEVMATDALHKVCGFETDFQFITKSHMRTIQKKSKCKE